MKKELLAPAGDIEAGYAALHYGADAVYLGLKHFSARATATNFDEEELNEFVGYAHAQGKKVYAAVNTLAEENELPQLLQSLDICSRCHVDALIVQDLGVARIAREQYPELELHASTQMAVHNREGALVLQKAGFSRVVLARELSLPEIKDIASVPGLETEVFIHGALCYSYSGLCLFSSLECGRSANRGKCLYPCRSSFAGEDGNKHYFSMKDMALKVDVLKLPVTSLKIEGRKKNALYVAAVTDYYRRILDGKGCDGEREENIRQIFSRPWTEFYLRGKDKSVVEPDFVGHRGLPMGHIAEVRKKSICLTITHAVARHDGIQIDVPGEERPFGFSLLGLKVNDKSVFEAEAGDRVEILLPPGAPALVKGLPVYLASSGRVKGAYDYLRPRPGEYRLRQPVDVEVTVQRDKIFACAMGERAEETGEFLPAKDAVRTNEAIRSAFGKTGDTPFTLRRLEIRNPDGLFAPLSLLNALRRSLYDRLKPDVKTTARPPAVDKPFAGVRGKWIVRTDKPASLAEIDLTQADEILVLLSPDFDVEELKKLPKNKVRLELPAVEPRPARFAETVRRLLDGGYKKWEIGNWWGLNVLPDKGVDVSFGASLYMLNTQAVQAAKDMGAGRVTLSAEDCLDNMQKLAETSPLPVVLPVYQDAPLFTSAVCVRANPCKDCPRGEKWLKFRRDGKEYPVLSKDCRTMLFAAAPLCFAAEAPRVGAAFYRVDFVYKPYSPAAAAAIWQRVRGFADVPSAGKGNLVSGGNF